MYVGNLNGNVTSVKLKLGANEARNTHICDKHPYQSIEEQVRSKNKKNQ